MSCYSTFLFSVETDPLPFNLPDEVLSLWNEIQLKRHYILREVSMTYQEQLPPNSFYHAGPGLHLSAFSQEQRLTLWLSVTTPHKIFAKS